MDNISMITGHAKVVGSTSLAKVFDLIKDPKSRYKEGIEDIRQLYMSGANSVADNLKSILPGFTCSGIFHKKRTTKNLEAYSGMLMLDLDKLQPGELIDARNIADAISYTHGYFISPSGYGLKIVVKVSSTANDHKTAYEQVKAYYEAELGHKLDKTCDVARLTYISYDEDAFFNENSAVFQVDLTQVKRPVGTGVTTGQNGTLNKGQATAAFKKAIAFTEKMGKFVEGNRNNFILQLACNCNRDGISLEDILDLCQEKYAEGWDEKEIKDIIIGAYNRYSDQAGQWKNLLPAGSSHLTITRRIKEEKNNPDEGDLEKTPIIPVGIINDMPSIIRNIAMMLTSERERDTFVTGALTILSGCLGGVKGVYDGNLYYPNLFCFIIAPAASGKGVLRLSSELGGDLNTKMKRESEESEAEYIRLMDEYNDAKKRGHRDVPKSEKPPFKLLFAPGNSSSASIYDHLNESGGIGIVCETEADTVASCMKNDWGNYSDLLRKVFHHEKISSGRKTTGKRNIEILNPRLSVALSGTVGQVKGLIPSAEDGLFSRFIYYQFVVERKWRDVSPSNGKGDMPSIIAAKAKEVSTMVEYLNKYPSEFKMTEQQWGKLNEYFSKKLTEVSCFVTEEASATVMRLGLIAFRIAMILSAIKKYEEGSKAFIIMCTDNHFEMSIGLVDIYLQHALLMYKVLPASNNRPEVGGKQKMILDKLPVQFTRDEAISISKTAGLHVSDSWIDRWLKRFLKYGYLVKPDYNVYRRVQASGSDQNLGKETCSSEIPLVTIGGILGQEEKAA